MRNAEELSRQLTEMYKETKEGKLHWNIQVQTTEHNALSEKPVETEDGIAWIVDECYVSYVCKYRGQDFCMVSYELIKTAGDKVQTTNLVFMPPMGIRAFHLQTLLPYAVPASQVLASRIKNLWELLIQMYKSDHTSVYLDVIRGTLKIED